MGPVCVSYAGTHWGVFGADGGGSGPSVYAHTPVQAPEKAHVY